MSRDNNSEPRRKSPPPQPGMAAKAVVAPKQGETKPTKPTKASNPIHRLGDYAHPPKRKK